MLNIPAVLFSLVRWVHVLIALCCRVEIILRAEAVEVAQAGDKCDFTGTLIVVPDVRQLNVPGKIGYVLLSCYYCNFTQGYLQE